MTGSELYTNINNTLNILIWPIIVLVLSVIFRTPIIKLLERFQNVEGSVGKFSFKVSLEKYMHDAVKRAVALEREGKSEQAKAIVREASNFAIELHDLSNSDIKHLVELSEGKPPKSRWGKIHLVRAGLIEIDGGHLTDNGKWFVNNYLKRNLAHNISLEEDAQ